MHSEHSEHATEQLTALSNVLGAALARLGKTGPAHAGRQAQAVTRAANRLTSASRRWRGRGALPSRAYLDQVIPELEGFRQMIELWRLEPGGPLDAMRIALDALSNELGQAMQLHQHQASEDEDEDD